MPDKSNIHLKVPIFYMQDFLSAEQSKLQAVQAADEDFMRNSYDKARCTFDKAQE